MQYRDLVPDRLGGKLIASHIRIPDGGPVPDYVHHHGIEFQVIYCYRGWVRVVYEDQGPPFVLEPGDCVVQPPHIRHRVLECSDGMEVVEVGSPAEHETFVDHELQLPTAEVNEDRDFHGQRFVRHESGKANWVPGPYSGFEVRDTGISEATRGVGSVLVIRPTASEEAASISSESGIVFSFVLQGSMTVQREDETQQAYGAEESFVMGAGSTLAIVEKSDDLELLQVILNK